MIENENKEFKREYTDNLLKSIVSFANTSGGELTIGIDDSGTVVGIKDIDDCYTRVTNSIRDAILPDITMFIKYEIDANNRTIKIIVAEGSTKPYFLRNKGMRPEGVFVRQGASSVPASVDKIRQMIKLSEKDTFETGRALMQDLHFETLKNEFNLKNLELNEEKYISLGIKSPDDGLYTNLAFLLSDECEHSIKFAIFEGTDKKTFRDRKEFEGSIFRQLRTCYECLELCNHTAGTFSGLDRIDKEDYPTAALREALLNALVHRDYSFSGSIIVNIFDDRIEFVSLGGLINGLSKEDIMRGVSQTRNKNLAAVFYRLKHIEAYGTGIQRIFDLYKEDDIKPEIIVTDNTFTMILPNRNISKNAKVIRRRTGSLSQQEEAIVNFIVEQGSISNEQIQSLLNVKKTRMYAIVKKMIEKGIVFAEGKAEKKRYFLKE